MLILGSPFVHPPGTMFSAIERLGLTSGLKLCLDASDINSYSGAGQSWLDTSGNGYDFFRGSTSASQATDPTFNGVAGAQSSSEYWSFDGGDYFTYDTADETWMQNIHKNNAQFTLCAWVYLGAVANMAVAGTTSTDPAKGCWAMGVSAASKLEIDILNTSGSAYEALSTQTVSVNAWSFLGVSINESAGTGTLQVGDVQQAITPTYSSPLSTNSDAPMQIGAAGSSLQPLANGSRVAIFSAWEGASLLSGDMLSIYNATKSKFGL